MYFRIGQSEAEGKSIRDVSFNALSQIIPLDTIRNVLSQRNLREQRDRKLKLEWVIGILIGMCLFPWHPIEEVLEKLLRGMSLCQQDEVPSMSRQNEVPSMSRQNEVPSMSRQNEVPSIASRSALWYRRRQVSIQAMAHLLREFSHSLARPSRAEALLFGRRAVALDGHVQDLPDTPAIEKVFGRHHHNRGECVYPQLQAAYLCEAHTRTIVDAEFWPCHTSEDVVVQRLIRSITPNMLVMWDRGLHSHRLFHQVLQRGAQVLARLPKGAKFKRITTLPDRSWLAWLYPSDRQKKWLLKVAADEGKTGWSWKRVRRHYRILVRVVEYTITDPELPGYGEVHRLVTTLLEIHRYPVKELVCAYHQRWEMEIAIRETSFCEQFTTAPLRSRTPRGVIQELYAMLIAHNLVRSWQEEAAAQAGIEPSEISYSSAIRIIGEAIGLLSLAPIIAAKLSEWFALVREMLLNGLLSHRVGPRRRRFCPRQVKQPKRSSFPAKSKKRYRIIKRDTPFIDAVALI